jgi:hypothetical protein
MTSQGVLSGHGVEVVLLSDRVSEAGAPELVMRSTTEATRGLMH